MFCKMTSIYSPPVALSLCFAEIKENLEHKGNLVLKFLKSSPLSGSLLALV